MKYEKSTLSIGEQKQHGPVGQRESANLSLDRISGADWRVQAARRSSALCNFGAPADIVLKLPTPVVIPVIDRRRKKAA